MIELRTKLKDIFIGFYLNGNKGNIILGPGMPQYLDKYHPFVTQANKLGYNLFIPRYMGTFESNGVFSTQNSKATLEATVEMVQNCSTVELFNQKTVTWDKAPIYLLGFSYGALPALLQNKQIDKTVIVCPFTSLDFHRGTSVGEDVSRTYEFLERAYPNLYRLTSKEVLADLQDISLPDIKENLTIVVGTKDTSIPEEEIQALVKKYHPIVKEKETGHSISMSDELFLELFT